MSKPLRRALLAAVLTVPALAAVAFRGDPVDPRGAVELRDDGAGPRVTVHGIGKGTPRADVIARHGTGFAGFFGDDDGRAPVFTRERFGADVVSDRFFTFREGRVDRMFVGYAAPPDRLAWIRARWEQSLGALERRQEGDALVLGPEGAPVVRIETRRAGRLEVEVVR
jgi:hypothetical protein